MATTNDLLETTNTKRSALLEFLLIVGRLKRSKRTGWVRTGVQDPESISDHMYRMSLMAFFLLPSSTSSAFDRDRAIKIALVHDLAESIVGDITPYDGVSKEEKHRLEVEAMSSIRTLLEAEHPLVAKELFELFEEYENGETNEAKAVKDLDKLEMVVSAYEYQMLQGKDLSDFYSAISSRDFETPRLAELSRELLSLRNQTSKTQHSEPDKQPEQ